jgi:F-type H+-transporting ATPase subunit delta
MSRSQVAQRYALTLLLQAEQVGNLVELVEPARSLATALRQEALLSFLQDPRQGIEQKRQLLRPLQGKVPEALTRFADFVIFKRRAARLPEILEQFVLQAEAQAGTRRGIVWSFAPMAADQLNRLSAKLQGGHKGQLLLENRIDPTLLGGFRVQIGDQVADATLRHKLDRIKQRMLA